ncbi:MAG: response regulator [Actinobacteria bacterium]|nr:response regulator [Actinomycetota bacterium]
MATGSILVVDDEYGVRSGIRTILEMDGYDVEAAGDGAEALAQIARRDFDVALLDYRLPDTDGLSLLHGMRERGCEAMVCMITAYANIDTAVAATRQGVDFFLPKPFTPDDLLGVVETLLRHRHARVEAERLRVEHEASLLALTEEKTQTHSLVSSLRDAVLVVNREGDVVLANRAMTGLLGKSEAEVLMRPAQELLGDGALAPLCEQLAAPVKDRTVKQLDIDEQSYMASIVTFRAEDGAALGRILTLSDISEVRRLATEKSRFIRMMVHELRSPLGSVKGVLEVLEDKSLGDELEPYLTMVARADARLDGLTGLISDLLSLSRIEQTSNDDDVELVALASFVDEALDVQREVMAVRDIGGVLDLPSDLPQVLVAPDDLRLVVSNLVGNAVKYNRDGGSVRVMAAVVKGGGDGDWLRLDVADTGLGIKQANLERIFTEFFREKRPETRELEGNGLGLAIVKRLVERAGGRLEVSSAAGEGSTFSVFLPA